MRSLWVVAVVVTGSLPRAYAATPPVEGEGEADVVDSPDGAGPATLPGTFLESREATDPASAPNVAPERPSTAASPRGPAPRRPPKNPAVAALLSLLFPGVGHFYLEEPATAFGLLAGGATFATAAYVTLLDGWPRGATERRDGWSAAYDDPIFLLASIWYQNVWAWAMFSAYRDARLQSGNRGYHYPVPEEDLGDLLLAPFRPGVMLQPEVGLGLLGWLAAGLAASYWVDRSLVSPGGTLFDRRRLEFMGERMPVGAGATLGELYYVALFTPVGIGEEALFRGYFQTSLTETMGPWGAWVAASLIFGLAHAPNALLLEDPGQRTRYLAYGLPYLTLSGAYLGWVYVLNDYSLSEVVALHFWYDFLLSSAAFVLDPDNQPFVLRVALPF